MYPIVKDAESGSIGLHSLGFVQEVWACLGSLITVHHALLLQGEGDLLVMAVEGSTVQVLRTILAYRLVSRRENCNGSLLVMVMEGSAVQVLRMIWRIKLTQFRLDCIKRRKCK